MLFHNIQFSLIIISYVGVIQTIYIVENFLVHEIYLILIMQQNFVTRVIDSQHGVTQWVNLRRQARSYGLCRLFFAAFSFHHHDWIRGADV